MVGMRTLTVKSVAEVAMPPGVVTRIRPVVAPAGTVAVTWVALLTVKLLAATLLKLTVVAPVKLVPVIVTTVPTGPVAGLKLVMVGGGITTKSLILVAFPLKVVIRTGPVVAPAGTMAETSVSLTMVKLIAKTLLKLMDVDQLKLVPIMVTTWPIGPLAGEKLVIVGVALGTKMLNALATEQPAAPVAVIVKLKVPAAVGVPLIRPLADSDNPLGKLPLVKAKVGRVVELLTDNC
jgi:hypothetical protein